MDAQVQKVEEYEKFEEIWTEVKRRTGTPKTARVNRQMIQIFVKMNGLKEILLTDTVGDIVRKIPNRVCSSKQEVYMTCEGRVLRWNDELRCSGVRDGCTVLIMSKMHGGGKHRNKKNKVERKPATCPQSQEPKEEKRILSCEDAENEVIQRIEENEETRKMIVRLAKGNNDDMERWIQIYTEMTELDDEQKMAVANGIRRAVQTRTDG